MRNLSPDNRDAAQISRAPILPTVFFRIAIYRAQTWPKQSSFVRSSSKHCCGKRRSSARIWDCRMPKEPISPAPI